MNEMSTARPLTAPHAVSQEVTQERGSDSHSGRLTLAAPLIVITEDHATVADQRVQGGLPPGKDLAA